MFNLSNITSKYEEKEQEIKSPVKKSIKIDALKVLNKVLEDVVNVNNDRVDTLRKICHDIESGKLDHASLIAFLKEPSKRKRKKK